MMNIKIILILYVIVFLIMWIIFFTYWQNSAYSICKNVARNSYPENVIFSFLLALFWPWMMFVWLADPDRKEFSKPIRFPWIKKL